MGIDKRTLPAIGTLIEGRPANPSAEGPQIRPVFEVVAHRYDEEDGAHLLELGESQTRVTASPVIETPSVRPPAAASMPLEVERGELPGSGIPFTLYQSDSVFLAEVTGEEGALSEIIVVGRGATPEAAQRDLSTRIVKMFSPSKPAGD